MGQVAAGRLAAGLSIFFAKSCRLLCLPRFAADVRSGRACLPLTSETDDKPAGRLPLAEALPPALEVVLLATLLDSGFFALGLTEPP